jgi:serine/threonine protein kinase
LVEPADSLPFRFGRYVLFDKIGEGGMAHIFLARTETELGGQRLVVVKQILPLLSASAEFSMLFIDEAKLAAQLSHGNVVRVFDLGREQDTLYIAMEYVEGFDLRDLLRLCSRHKVPLLIEFALLIITETLRGLDHAHRKRNDDGSPLGIVHRDVSPSNILLSFEGEVKLCDFGIALALGAGGELPEQAIQGKAGYMSPEAANGEALDARADLFSVGVILWELISGRRLYRADAGPLIEQARAARVPELPDRVYPEQERLYGIVMRALERDPTRRFASAREMLQELESYVADAEAYASPLRFGEWLLEHFGQDIVERRRARERAAQALEAAAPSGKWPAPPVESPQPQRISTSDHYLPPPPPQQADDTELVDVPRMQPPPLSLAALATGAQAKPRARSAVRGAVTALLVVLLVAAMALSAYLMRGP